jgi:hypothetical protein
MAYYVSCPCSMCEQEKIKDGYIDTGPGVVEPAPKKAKPRTKGQLLSSLPDLREEYPSERKVQEIAKENEVKLSDEMLFWAKVEYYGEPVAGFLSFVGIILMFGYFS